MVSHTSRGTPRRPVPAAIRAAAARLADAGVPSPRNDAELIAAHVLGVPRARLLLVDEFPPGQGSRFEALVEARARRVPLQHLLGTAPFRTLDLQVGPGVFVPRPETESLVDVALSVAAGGDRGGSVAAGGDRRGSVAGTGDTATTRPLVVDLCSGSGAIALAVAHEVPGATVYAVEVDPAALDWLRRNATAREAAGDPPVRVVAGDVTDPDLLSDLDGTVDVVLCNPPYVPLGTPVPPEVAEHDPVRAVFAADQGLAIVRAVVPLAARLLKSGGWFAVEHDDSHGAAVPALIRADGRFADVEARRDLAGRPRYTVARRDGWQTGTS
ncbi:MAG TPA: peptide chain release factor N(5)-glutamine methyltransferase [Micromonosporaceae bacterium]